MTDIAVAIDVDVDYGNTTADDDVWESIIIKTAAAATTTVSIDFTT